MNRKQILEFEKNFTYRDRVRKKNIHVIIFNLIRMRFEGALRAHYIKKMLETLPTFNCEGLPSGGIVCEEGRQVIGNLENREKVIKSDFLKQL